MYHLSDAAILHADDIQAALHLCVTATVNGKKSGWLLAVSIWLSADACCVVYCHAVNGEI